MYDHNFPNLQITRSDIMPCIKWVVSLVIAYSQLKLPQGFVRVFICYNTHFITPKDIFIHYAIYIYQIGCQPGDCIWSLKSSSGVCECMYLLRYSLYHSRGFLPNQTQNLKEMGSQPGSGRWPI